MKNPNSTYDKEPKEKVTIHYVKVSDGKLYIKGSFGEVYLSPLDLLHIPKLRKLPFQIIREMPQYRKLIQSYLKRELNWTIQIFNEEGQEI